MRTAVVYPGHGERRGEMTMPAAWLRSRAMPTRERCSRVAVRAAVLFLGIVNPGLAAQVDPGRLFFTVAQRAQLEDARARNLTQPDGKPASGDGVAAPLRYDGVVIRSDGNTTRWVNGTPQVGASRTQGLKPGQIRVDGKVYEPYQVLRPAAPSPAKAGSKEATP